VDRDPSDLNSRKSVRSFKGIICDDISEFESSMPSHAVWCLWDLTLPLELIHVNWRRRRKPSVLRLPSATSAATFPIHRASLFSPLRR
jgi:hypothetical protein